MYIVCDFRMSNFWRAYVKWLRICLDYDLFCSPVLESQHIKSLRFKVVTLHNYVITISNILAQTMMVSSVLVTESEQLKQESSLRSVLSKESTLQG